MPQEFVSGLFVNDPRENAPEFVVGSLSISVDKFIPYLHEKANAKGYVNIDLLRSKDGKLYAKINDWKPKEKFVKKDGKVAVEQDMEEDEEINVGNIPF